MGYTALGSYVFAGGFTVGMQRAGFDVPAHLEDNGYGVGLARHNLPDLSIYVGVEDWPLAQYRGVDVVYGNPPCAAWSSLNGKRTSSEQTWKLDDRVDCTRKHFALLEALQPRVWVWESVQRALSTGREFVDELAARALELGYAVHLVTFDGQHVGLPHRRKRFFFVATRVEVDWWKGFVEPPTAGEVLAEPPDDLDDRVWLTGAYREAWRHAVHLSKFNCGLVDLAVGFDAAYPNPERRVVGNRTVTKGRPAFRYKVVGPHRVLPTVVGDSVIRWDEPRRLTPSEHKRACGYPGWYVFEPRSLGNYDLLTRAVMPPVGEWLGYRLRAALGQNVEAEPQVLRVDLERGSERREFLPELHS